MEVEIKFRNGEKIILQKVKEYKWNINTVVVTFKSGYNAIFNPSEICYIAQKCDLEGANEGIFI